MLQIAFTMGFFSASAGWWIAIPSDKTLTNLRAELFERRRTVDGPCSYGELRTFPWCSEKTNNRTRQRHSSRKHLLGPIWDIRARPFTGGYFRSTNRRLHLASKIIPSTRLNTGRRRHTRYKILHFFRVYVQRCYAFLNQASRTSNLSAALFG